jgi:oxalate decarboxylase
MAPAEGSEWQARRQRDKAVKRNNGHYVKNVGDTELQYLEVFRSSYYADVSLSDWLTHSPPEMVAETLNIDEATIAKFPNDRPLVMPNLTAS